MALKSLICPSCNGQIDTFDERSMKGICPFCGNIILNIPELQTQFKLDSEGRVVVSGIEGADELFSRIEANLRFDDMNKALSLALEYTDKYPTHFRGWKALCDATIDGAFANNYQSRELELAFDRMGKTATTEEDRKQMEKLRQRAQQLADRASQRILEIDAELQSAQKKLDAVNGSHDKLVKSNSRIKGKSKSEVGEAGMAAGAVAMVAAWFVIGMLGIMDMGTGFIAGVVVGVIVAAGYTSTTKRAIDDYSSKNQELSARISELNSQISTLNHERFNLSAYNAYLDNLIAKLL